MWNYEGLIVSGNYMNSIPVKGLVEKSRVKYGGGVCHTLQLDRLVHVYGRVTDRVILDHDQIEQVWDNTSEEELYQEQREKMHIEMEQGLTS